MIGRFTRTLLSGLLLPVTLAAQQNADTVAIPIAPIEVIGSITSLASGPALSSGMSGRTMTISEPDLDAWRPRFAVDALRLHGAALYDDLGSPFKQSVVLRGFTAGPVVGMPQGVSVFVDGIPMNEPGSGDVAFDLLPLGHVQRIEVLSGTATLLGPNSLGGAINLVTRRGGVTGERSVELSVGSHERYGVTGNVTGTSSGWDYYAGGGHEQEEGWRRRMSGERSHFFASLGQYGERSGIRFQALAARSHAQTAGSLPLSVYALRPDSNLTAGDFEALRQIQLAASGYLNTLGGLASARMFYRANDAERFNANQEVDPDVRGFSEGWTLGLDMDWRATRQLRTSQLSWRVGGGASANRTAIELFAERIDPGQTTNVESPIRRADAYAVADWNIGSATLSAGLRFDAVRIPFRNLRDPARDTTSVFLSWSPRASAAVELASFLSAYVSAGRGFRAPALIEIACADPAEPCPLPFALGDDPPIAPVRVLTYDAGLRWATGRSSGDVAIYRSNVSDDIFLFPYGGDGEPEGSTIDGYFGNVERTRREGIELNARSRLTRHLSAWANYSLTRATFQTDEVEIFSIREAGGAENEVAIGDRFPLVPDFTLAVGVSTALRAFSLGTGASWVGERFLRGDEANDEPPLQSYAVTNLHAGYDASNWALRLVVRNLTDASFVSFGGFNINQGAGGALERFLTPGAPRSIEVSIQHWF